PSAEPAPAGAEEQAAGAAEEEIFAHGMQFGLRVGIVAGYRMVFRYDESPFCRQPDPEKADKDEQKLCGHWAPPALDLAVSFAPLDFIEPYVWARFGLSGEEQTNTKPLLAFGAGARIYTSNDSKFKVFVEPAVGAEVEAGEGSEDWQFTDEATGVRTSPEYKTDLLFHLAVGPQYDFARYVGMYVHGGLTTGVLRYIHTELELSLGVQVRVP
ncbi:MAG TPA: hypothetical protein VIW29_21060, partial [Polyangiaceae bacterium]